MEKIYFDAINAAIKAGNEILKIYNSNDFNITVKSDNSPLTIADQKSNDIINSILKNTDIPIISEENKQINYSVRKNWNKYWLIDPLDGTKEFIKKNGEFTVNIALVKNSIPIFGVIFVPAKKNLYFAAKEFNSNLIKNISDTFKSPQDILNNSRKLPFKRNDNLYKVVASKSHFNEDTKKFIQKLEKKHSNIELVNAGSSLKLCLIAEGNADIYPRYAPTMEWDIAAGHAIVKFAGGKVIQAKNNKDVIYNKKNLLNPFFIAYK